MRKTEFIEQNFNVKQFDMPKYLKLFLKIKHKFDLNEVNIDDILRKVKANEPISQDIRKYIYEKMKICINSCTNCPLAFSESASQKVMGKGTIRTPLMLIGEGPGFQEDKLGKPFVGRAGQLLTVILTKLGINRDNVYITNVIKCRPPRNRNPKESEIKSCSQNLDMELEFIAPKVIITLGAIPLDYFSPGSRVMRSRGNWIYTNNCWIMPTYHPAFILRQRGRDLYKVKWQVWGDFNKALDKVKEFYPEYKFK